MEFGLAFLVQKFDLCDFDFDDGRRRTVVRTGEPYTVLARDLGTWAHVTHHLLRWQWMPSETVGAIDLFEPRPATPTMALTDAACPTFTVLKGLSALGWVRTNDRATHTLGGDEGKVFFFSIDGDA